MRKTSNNKTSLATVWTKHLPDQESKDKFEQTIRASTTMAYRLLEILEEEEAQLDSQTPDFDSPSWAYHQAFRLGEKQRIKKLRDLLAFVNIKG